ncbi:hypothetical protein RJ639_011398, partial [Escallonia herrerae]
NNVENEEGAKFRVLKRTLDAIGIEGTHCAPGHYSNLVCPKADVGAAHDGVDQNSKVNSTRQMTEESLGLEPLGDKLIAYFAERMISKDVLQKNFVMQTSADQPRTYTEAFPKNVVMDKHFSYHSIDLNKPTPIVQRSVASGLLRSRSMYQKDSTTQIALVDGDNAEFTLLGLECYAGNSARGRVLRKATLLDSECCGSKSLGHECCVAIVISTSKCCSSSEDGLEESSFSMCAESSSSARSRAEKLGNAIAFTYRRNGVLVNCKYRSILNKKFWQEKGAEKILYGLDNINSVDELIIVEGEIDKLSMEQAGLLTCVSVPDGAPQKVSAKELPSLEKASRIILATDSDIPGQALAEELARRLGRERCWLVRWPKKDKYSYFKDANEGVGRRYIAELLDFHWFRRIMTSCLTHVGSHSGDSLDSMFEFATEYFANEVLLLRMHVADGLLRPWKSI